MSDDICPVCHHPLNGPPGDVFGPPERRLAYFNCPRCGNFGLTGTAIAVLPGLLEMRPRQIPAFSYAIRRAQQSQELPVFNSEVCQRIVETAELPTPQEQADNLIRWLGDKLPGPGEPAELYPSSHEAIIGARGPAGFRFVVDGLLDQGLLFGSSGADGSANVSLTFLGWSRYEELRRGVPSGWKAFIAMKYGDQVLDRLVTEVLRPAVAHTGFTLTRLDDEPKAGLIDYRLRVEIQSCRFLIADLTHHNNGAYWEAGYAEGLGKPVIYMCEAERLRKGTHFDTSHQMTVIWREADPTAAAAKLKATIRATIPEARREA
jgi:hypothetical protein